MDTKEIEVKHKMVIKYLLNETIPFILYTLIILCGERRIDVRYINSFTCLSVATNCNITARSYRYSRRGLWYEILGMKYILTMKGFVDFIINSFAIPADFLLGFGYI